MTQNTQYICVFASSSNALDKIFFQAAKKLGKEMTDNGYSLVYGAGMTGLMGEVARSVKQGNGRIVGTIPEVLNVQGVRYDECDEIIVTQTMHQRKAAMADKAVAFVALAGGFGTFEELLEIITLKQLRYHNKAIVILNTKGYYDNLLAQFEVCYNENFAKEVNKKLYYVTTDETDAINYIKQYQPAQINEKWLTSVE